MNGYVTESGQVIGYNLTSFSLLWPVLLRDCNQIQIWNNFSNLDSFKFFVRFYTRRSCRNISLFRPPRPGLEIRCFTWEVWYNEALENGLDRSYRHELALSSNWKYWPIVALNLNFTLGMRIWLAAYRHLPTCWEFKCIRWSRNFWIGSSKLQFATGFPQLKSSHVEANSEVYNHVPC